MWYQRPFVSTGSSVENGSAPTNGDAPRSKDKVPPGFCRISQSPPTPITRPTTAEGPAPRIQKATVPTDGGVKAAFVWAMPPVPFVFSALLPAQVVSHVAPPERVAGLPTPELSAAVVPAPSENFQLPTKP